MRDSVAGVLESKWRSPEEVVADLMQRIYELEDPSLMGKTASMAFRWDEFVLDVDAHRLEGGSGEIHLEPQAFDLLVYLVENRTRVVPKAELLDSIWGDQFVSESALTTRIKHARKALGDDGRAQRYIRNVHGRGYQFVGELDSSDDLDLKSSPSQPSLPAPRDIRLGDSIAVDDEFPFVGRMGEISEIASALEAHNDAAQIYIGGAPGLGKSRLALEVLDRAARTGAIVCAGRCDEHVTSALQPIRDALGQLALTRPAEFRTWCEGLEGQMLHLLPSAVDVLAGDPVLTDGYASVDVALAVLERAAQQAPVVLLVDDLQWSDDQTRALLSQLHRRSTGGSISTVATFRSGAPDLPEAARAWIRTQRRAQNAVAVYLDELDDEAALELSAAVLGENDAEAHALLERTSGHALFLTEALRDRTLGAEASSSVIELIDSRLERLDAAVRDLVRAGAVYGPAFPFEVVGRAAGLDPAQALEAVDVAIEAELLHETDLPTRFRFSHQLVPEAIRGGLSRSASCRLHKALADELEALESDDAEVAWHILGAVPLIQVEHALAKGIAVAEAALAENEFDRSIRLLQRCLTLDVQTRQRAELHILLGQALLRSGRSIAGVPHADEAASLARQNGWVDLLVECALLRYGLSPFRNVSERETVALLREALAALPLEPSIDRAKLTSKLAVFLTFDESLETRRAMLSEAAAMSAEAGPADRVRLIEANYIVLSCPDGVGELAEYHNELEAMRAESGLYWNDAAAPETLHMMRGEGDLFRQVAFMDEDRHRRQPIAAWRRDTLGTTLATWAGDFDEARRLCDFAAAIGEPYWGESTVALQVASHLLIDQLTDDYGRSFEIFELILAFSRSLRILPGAGLAAAGMGHPSANEIADELVERKKNFEWFGGFIMGGNMLSNSAELGLALDHDELCDLSERYLEPHADLVLGVPWGPSLAAADSLARLARRRGDTVASDRYLEQARGLYDRLDAPALRDRLDRLIR